MLVFLLKSVDSRLSIKFCYNKGYSERKKMHIVDKFLNLIGLNSRSETARMFDALAKGGQISQISDMLKGGYTVDEQNTVAFFDNWHEISNEDLKLHLGDVFGLIYSSIERTIEINNPKKFDIGRALKLRKDHDAMYDSKIRESEKIKKSFAIWLEAKNFDNLNITQKINFNHKFKEEVKNLGKYVSSYYNQYLGDSIAKIETISKNMDNVISSGVGQIMEMEELKKPVSVSKEIEARLSPELLAIIQEIEKKVSNFNETKIELGMQERVIIKRIMEQDIPLMATSAALFPVELKTKFINDDGQDVNSALLDLVKGYKDTIWGIIDSAEQMAVQKFHKDVKINRVYIDKIQASNVGALDSREVNNPLKMAIGKK